MDTEMKRIMTKALNQWARRALVALMLSLLLLLLAACRSAETPLPTPIVEATQPAAPTPAESPPALPTTSPATAVPSPIAVTPTIAPTSPPTATAAAPTATAIPPTNEPAAIGNYRVVFVTADDVLNVRSGPGPDFDVVGELPPEAEGVEVQRGSETFTEGSTWVMVNYGAVEGWVNSRFLTEMVETAAFCDDSDALALIEDLGTAIASEDGLLLGSLVHPERGLRLRHDWWNPEVFVEGEAVADLFGSTESYDWGTEDGSGFAINGTFSEVLLPTLQEDFLTATEIGCDEFLSGATTGLVQLPEEYEALHFFSVHRPAEDESGFDWGTWVVGVDKWQGAYYLSFLIHYDYEI
jgi:hypothetical protein